MIGGPGTPARAALHHLRDEIESGLRELEARMAAPGAGIRLPFENRLSRPLASHSRD
jgi:hypothetical protein